MSTMIYSRAALPTLPPAIGASFGPDPYDPDVIKGRTDAGRRAELTADTLPKGIAGRPAPAYFRTYEQVKTAMFALQSKYPDLVRVEDLGDSAEKLAGGANRDILALVLTNSKATGPKPSTLHVGGIHAREIANPELLMTFATQLLEGFERNPDSTMMLNSRETVLVPILNPDGHAVVERGFAGERDGSIMQRKSTSGGDPSLGTDLNRNFDFHWGGAGSSSSPRSEIYRGARAGSEPETQAIQSYLLSKKPSFFIDWHSYSQLNMYPWGDTREKTADHDGFKAMAEKFTTFNGYSPIQSIQLYPTTGTTEDYAYGVPGVPAMVIETGTVFHQSDGQFEQTLRENLPVLSYTVKTADAPFKRVLGPDTFELLVDPATREVRASITDARNGAQVLAAAELVTDPMAAPGSGSALKAADGTFDSVNEIVTGSATSIPGLSDDATAGALVYVRGKDIGGNWGPLTAQWLTGPPAPKPVPTPDPTPDPKPEPSPQPEPAR